MTAEKQVRSTVHSGAVSRAAAVWATDLGAGLDLSEPRILKSCVRRCLPAWPDRFETYSYAMDWTTVGATASALLGGGILGAAATLYATRKQTHDRRQALALERERWEHERDRSIRERQRATLESAISALEGLGSFTYEAYKNPARLNAVVGEFHEARVVAGQVHRAALDLNHHGLSQEGGRLEVVLTRFGEAVQDFNERTYHSLFETQLDALEALRARMAGIP